MKSFKYRSLFSNRASNLLSKAFQQDSQLKKIRGRYSPGSILFITIFGIAIAEIIAMIVIYFYRYLPYYQQVLMDATVMTIIVFPILYFLSFRPLLLHIQKRYKVEQVLEARLRLVDFANTHNLSQLLQFTLDEIEALTGSTIGYFHFLEANQKDLRLQAFSTNTVKNICSVANASTHCAVDQAKIWIDCIRERQPVIHNEYWSLLKRHGTPEESAPIAREMAIPILRNELVVAILGVGNKSSNFKKADVEVASTLADFAWDIVQQKQAGDALRASEEKFRTLVDWTYDWENWIDPQGNIVYISPSCERITGYSPQAFINDPDLLVHIVHPDDRDLYLEHHQIVHDETIGMEKVEYRVLTCNGDVRWIEHNCRPLYGADLSYLGRRISNRDITERKQTEKEIEERNQKEKLLTQTIHTMQLDIARDLHDTVGQNISFLRMKLEYLAWKKGMKRAEMQAEIQTMIKSANESYDLIRGMLAVLQSGETTDLFKLFSRYAEQIEERAPFKVEFFIQGEAKTLSAKRMRQLFYMFREALNNIEKHAQATQVAITITWNADHLVFTVTDNGTGFDTSQVQFSGHYGLKFMRDRVELLNGIMEIQAEINAGTKIIIQVPYE